MIYDRLGLDNRIGEVFVIEMFGFGGVLVGVIGRPWFGVNCLGGIVGIFLGVLCLAAR